MTDILDDHAASPYFAWLPCSLHVGKRGVSLEFWSLLEERKQLVIHQWYQQIVICSEHQGCTAVRWHWRQKVQGAENEASGHASARPTTSDRRSTFVLPCRPQHRPLPITRFPRLAPHCMTWLTWPCHNIFARRETETVGAISARALHVRAEGGENCSHSHIRTSTSHQHRRSSKVVTAID